VRKRDFERGRVRDWKEKMKRKRDRRRKRE